jgi:hypothetical protein
MTCSCDNTQIAGSDIVHVSSEATKCNASPSETEEGQSKESAWNVDEISLLIKAVKKFPGGTKNRFGFIFKAVSPFYDSDAHVGVLLDGSKYVTTLHYIRVNHLVQRMN